LNLQPNASYSFVVRIRIPRRIGILASIAQPIASAHGFIAAIQLVEEDSDSMVQELIIDASGEEHARRLGEVLSTVPDLEILEQYDRTFRLHEGGKLTTGVRHPLRNQADMSMAYTPGVARICKAIAADPELGFRYTIRKNTVAIVTDGSAVLGLGNIGSLAGLPVMEGKAALFKSFGDVDAFPICLDTQDSDEIVRIVTMLAPTFGGINLEDISAPRCFEIEKRLVESLDIPVFHDDQHGTAIVTLAALYNALKVTGRKMEAIRVVINGAGAAGITVARLLRTAGVEDFILCDSKGILALDRPDLTEEKKEFAIAKRGDLADAMRGVDVFIGLSVPHVVTREMVQSMAAAPIVFAMSNPTPEVQPEAINDIAAVVATGRSDYPNQINNVLAFPGIFRGALDCRARRITRAMHMAAAQAIAALVGQEDLDKGKVIPPVFDQRVAPAVAAAVIAEARKEGLARI
jgi:malate dehydrogenase (oxaloacetate-decarboxylating)